MWATQTRSCFAETSNKYQRAAFWKLINSTEAILDLSIIHLGVGFDFLVLVSLHALYIAKLCHEIRLKYLFQLCLTHLQTLQPSEITPQHQWKDTGPFSSKQFEATDQYRHSWHAHGYPHSAQPLPAVWWAAVHLHQMQTCVLQAVASVVWLCMMKHLRESLFRLAVK